MGVYPSCDPWPSWPTLHLCLLLQNAAPLTDLKRWAGSINLHRISIQIVKSQDVAITLSFTQIHQYCVVLLQWCCAVAASCSGFIGQIKVRHRSLPNVRRPCKQALQNRQNVLFLLWLNIRFTGKIERPVKWILFIFMYQLAGFHGGHPLSISINQPVGRGHLRHSYLSLGVVPSALRLNGRQARQLFFFLDLWQSTIRVS